MSKDELEGRVRAIAGAGHGNSDPRTDVGLRTIAGANE